jgi:hypothetical protein
LFLIHERLVRFRQQSGRIPLWSEFAIENADLLNRKSKAILRDYYGDDALASDVAKKIFVLPHPIHGHDPDGTCRK